MNHSHGMLFVATNISPQDEADFNMWYDKEHVAERVGITGFLSGTRFVAINASRKYLGLYETESLDTFTSEAYHAAFHHQTDWSVSNLQKMVNPMRRVCEISQRHGRGTGSFLAVLVLPSFVADSLFSEWQANATSTPGYISSYILAPDVALSSPLPRENAADRPMQPMLLISCSSINSCKKLAERAQKVFSGDIHLYTLDWHLTRQEMAHG
ncbi:DUF4286 family protein [uncultured Pantoea sp.]|uniref:DUF4286 family protein n=1 Tax=uncultured Pantoea sp. TaxID=218084 RepID=UPI00258B4780|nr:DUF4286 family protein [uncultured Pantoea sp.]